MVVKQCNRSRAGHVFDAAGSTLLSVTLVAEGSAGITPGTARVAQGLLEDLRHVTWDL